VDVLAVSRDVKVAPGGRRVVGDLVTRVLEVLARRALDVIEAIEELDQLCGASCALSAARSKSSKKFSPWA
jgi:hypothetical protein